MSTALALKDVEFIADELPGHEQQMVAYEAAGLEARDAFMLEAHAARILTVAKRGILEIGQELLAARERAKHGTWATFLQRAQIEERTAQNYMNAAQLFGDKPDVAGLLSNSAMVLLGQPSADPQVVQEVIEEVRSGAPAPKVEEVKSRLAAAKPAPASAPARPAPAPVQLTPRAPTPTPAARADEEIAAAQPPAPLPMLTPMAPAAAPADRKVLICKRALLAAALELLDGELAQLGGPTIVVDGGQALAAARLFIAAPALNGAAGMLVFSAREE